MRKIVKNTSSGQRAQQLINPTKDKKGSYRVERGGAWRYAPSYTRASLRGISDPSARDNSIGFRIVRNAS